MAFCLLSALTLQRIVRREVGHWSTWRPLSFWCCARQRRVDAKPHTPSPQPNDDHEHDQHTDAHEHSRSHGRRLDAQSLDRIAADEDERAARDEQHDDLTEDALATHLAHLHAAGGVGVGGPSGGGSGSAPRSQSHTRNSSADSTVVAEFGEDGDVHLLRSSRRAAAQQAQRRSSSSANGNSGAAAGGPTGVAAQSLSLSDRDRRASPDDEFAHTVASGAYKPYHSPASQIAADLKASLLRR